MRRKLPLPTPTRRQARILVLALLTTTSANIAYAVTVRAHARDVTQAMPGTVALAALLTYAITIAVAFGAGTQVSWWRFYFSSDSLDARLGILMSWFRGRWYTTMVRAAGWPVVPVLTALATLIIANVALYLAWQIDSH